MKHRRSSDPCNRSQNFQPSTSSQLRCG